ncbi:hypothetical protein phiA034_gene0062 [Aeromonas phage phiA034]|uniref:Uncharacterized protein n=1 Tax=Aeromonas phage phiA034 TaxID=2985287 RepID=A0AAF0C0Q3_9CAUD|nr:hypothetical protein phiA034_gene0062 [Aeromonas phage phiA034]
MINDMTVWPEGYQAGKQGRALEDNPYNRDAYPSWHEQWAKGWAAATGPAPRTFEQYGEFVAALETGPIRIGSLTLEKGASRYLMRDERTGNSHSLEISETNPMRLAAHWLGFVSNATPDHGEDVVILLPVVLPNGRRVYDRDKVALIDYLDNLASVEGHPLHGVEFRIYFSPSSVDGPAELWGDGAKIDAANLAQLVADFLARCPKE